MPGVSEKTALDVMKKAMQSDSKTDQKNKQSQVMLRDKHGKVDRDNLVYQQLYLKGQSSNTSNDLAALVSQLPWVDLHRKNASHTIPCF